MERSIVLRIPAGLVNLFYSARNAIFPVLSLITSFYFFSYPRFSFVFEISQKPERPKASRKTFVYFELFDGSLRLIVSNLSFEWSAKILLRRS